MRAVDLMAQAQDNSLIQGLIFMTLWHGQMQGTSSAPIGVRELARRLGLPYETVRRHALSLVRRGQCVRSGRGLTIPTQVLRRACNVDLLRKLYLETVRLLGDLARVGVARSTGSIRKLTIAGSLSEEQTVIAGAGMGSLLAGMKASLGYSNGDLLKGMVYSAIWTANVKHVTNAASAIHEVMPDELRLPVSVMAISHSLRLPYETTRRYALALVNEGKCLRVGRQGLVVPQKTHRDAMSTTIRCYGVVLDLLAELRRAGIKV
jgi:hypothetical protein